MLKSLFINWILPVIIIIYAFKYNLLLGMFAVLLFFVYIFYKNHVKIFEVLGKYHYAKGNTQTGLKWFEKAYRSKKATPYTMVLYAYILLKNGEINVAEEILSNLINSKLNFEDEMNVKSNYALVLWKKGLIGDAVKTLEDVIQQYENTTLYGSLGYMLIASGDLDKALEFNLKAYEYNDANGVIIDNLAQTYYLRKDYHKAEELYEKLMESKPAFPEAYYNYGLVLLQVGKHQEAYDSMKKALQYGFTYLSTVTKQEVESRLKEIERLLK